MNHVNNIFKKYKDQSWYESALVDDNPKNYRIKQPESWKEELDPKKVKEISHLVFQNKDGDQCLHALRSIVNNHHLKAKCIIFFECNFNKIYADQQIPADLSKDSLVLFVNCTTFFPEEPPQSTFSIQSPGQTIVIGSKINTIKKLGNIGNRTCFLDCNFEEEGSCNDFSFQSGKELYFGSSCTFHQKLMIGKENPSMTFEDCTFKKGIEFADNSMFTKAEPFSFQNCTFEGPVTAQGFKFEKGLKIENSFVNEISFKKCTFLADTSFKSTTFNTAPDFEAVKFSPKTFFPGIGFFKKLRKKDENNYYIIKSLLKESKAPRSELEKFKYLKTASKHSLLRFIHNVFCPCLCLFFYRFWRWLLGSLAFIFLVISSWSDIINIIDYYNN